MTVAFLFDLIILELNHLTAGFSTIPWSKKNGPPFNSCLLNLRCHDNKTV